MPNQHTCTLRRGEQTSHFAAIAKELAFLKAQRARLPTRKDQARTALLAILTGAVLTLSGIELFFW
jgi:hypothetical protein